MADPFLGEIRAMPYTFAPTGWAFCQGQQLPIHQNTALYAVLSTYYGGDGKTWFALPRLEGVMPMMQGAGPGLTPRAIGQAGGEQAVQLTFNTTPTHTHQMSGVNQAGDSPIPTGNSLARYTNAYQSTPDRIEPLSAQTLSTSGGTSPHNNLQPYLVLNFAIAIMGQNPSPAPPADEG